MSLITVSNLLGSNKTFTTLEYHLDVNHFGSYVEAHPRLQSFSTPDGIISWSSGSVNRTFYNSVELQLGSHSSLPNNFEYYTGTNRVNWLSTRSTYWSGSNSYVGVSDVTNEAAPLLYKSGGNPEWLVCMNSLGLSTGDTVSITYGFTTQTMTYYKNRFITSYWVSGTYSPTSGTTYYDINLMNCDDGKISLDDSVQTLTQAQSNGYEINGTSAYVINGTA